MRFINHNGHLLPEDSRLFGPENRSYRYGDGCFETMKVHRGTINLASFHFERLFLSLKMLRIDCPEPVDPASLSNQVLELCTANNCTETARIRLSFYRAEMNQASYCIEAWPLKEDPLESSPNGLKLDIYPYARKGCDAFSNLKSANFLPYVLAALHARENGLDDCVVLNTENQICDTSKANIFLVKNGSYYTPALSQGCINGVMRRFVIDQLKSMGCAVHQQAISPDDLLAADEVFVTNAIIGLQWVKSFQTSQYRNQQFHLLRKHISSNLV
jgi:branched-chain amino acid aminotransferase